MLINSLISIYTFFACNKETKPTGISIFTWNRFKYNFNYTNDMLLQSLVKFFTVLLFLFIIVSTTVILSTSYEFIISLILFKAIS